MEGRCTPGVCLGIVVVVGTAGTLGAGVDVEDRCTLSAHGDELRRHRVISAMQHGQFVQRETTYVFRKST